MQNTLLALAIAIILALVSALVAPSVINWNRYRSSFEAEASRLTGLTVQVNGAIDARILPTPHLKLRDVVIGQPGRPPLARAAGIELEVGLGPLLRGQVRATELRLVAPQINLGLDQSGAIDWPAPAPSFRPEALAISRFDVEEGRVTLTDARSDARLVLQKLSFNGDIRSFVGPFSGDGAFVAGGETYGYRISGGRGDADGGFKLRLGVDPSSHPLTTAIDGTLSFEGGSPQFDGTLSLARPAGATLAGGRRVMSDPWQLGGRIHATPAAASFKDLVLQYGPDERAVNFSGTAELTFGAHPHLDGVVSAVQVDVDRMLANPDETHRPPFVMLRSFLAAFVAAVKPPLPGKVEVAVDGLTVGGTAIQSLRGNVRFDGGRWRLDDFAFRAPGSTEVKLSGRLDADSQGLSFSGPGNLESSDVKTLVAWLEGRGEQQPSGPPETLTARGDVTIASDRLALDRLSAAFNRENVEGRLAYTWAAGDRPAALEGELRAAALDVDALMAFAKAAASDAAFQVPRKVALVLDVDKATLAGVDARQINARGEFDTGVLHIDRLSIADLAGAMIAVSGRIDDWSSRPVGRLALDIDASTLSGLTDVIGKFAPPVAASLRPFVGRLTPVKIHGALTVDRTSAGSIAKLELGGGLGAMRLALDGQATGDPTHPATAVVDIKSRLDADDGGAIVRLLGLNRVLAVDQLPGQLTIAADGPLNGDVQVNGLATAGGFSAAVAGALQLSGREAPAGSLQLKASAADLRPLRRTMTGQPGAAVPISASAIVGIAGPDLTFTDVAMTAGRSALRGRLDLKLASPLDIGGTIEGDKVDAASVAALLLGLPSAAPGDGRPWSAAPVGAGAFAALNGDLTVKFDHAALTPSLVARDLKGVVQFRPQEIGMRDIEGSLAGGRLSGELDFRRVAEKFAAQGHLALTDANAAAIVSGKNAVNGVLTVSLRGESMGLSPDGLVGSLHGSGTVALAKAQFAGIDPAAFAVAVRTADQSGAVEPTNIAAAVSAVMDKGRFVVPQSQAEVTIAAGQIYLTNATLRGQDGAALALDGVLDLDKEALDAHLTLSGQPAANALISARPELAIRVKGPLAAPAWQLDVSALVSWLTLRATEQQTRRLESVEANRRADVLGPVIRPASPLVRFIPRGTALEGTGEAASLVGVRAYDRLRPEAPPPEPAATTPVPRPAPGRDRTTASVGAAQPAPPPAARSPLDLLFRSQN